MKIFREIQIWLLIIGLITIASGCSEVDPPAVMDNIPPTQTSPAATKIILEYTRDLPTQTSEPTQPPAPGKLERPHYSLTAFLDYSNHLLIVDEDILIPHPAQKKLENITLVIPPNNWPDAFSIHAISAREHVIGGYEVSGVRLFIELSEPAWQPGQTLDLHISYTLDLPELGKGPVLGPSPFGYSSRQTNLVDWYPMIPPYQADLGWVVHDPWKFGEYLVFPAADFDVSLELSASGLTTAASSVPLNEGNPTLYSLDAARNFVLSISPDYRVLTEDLNGTRVYGYSFPGYQDPGQAVFLATLEALQLYSELFGPYDQSGFSMVQGDFNYGMEYEGLYFQGTGYYDSYNGTEQSYLVTIAVHETAHQWWYGKVANDQALEPWLDEAFCTFSELAYYEQLYPGSVDWWWRTRVNYYDPYGRIDRSIYDFQEYGDQYLNYRNATYLQGAKFMAALKSELGDEQFYAFLRDYAARNQAKIATSKDFFSLLGEYLDLGSLSWLGEYFELD